MSSPSPSDPPVAAAQNPSHWRFTWEAQSHASLLRLHLFNTRITPPAQCRALKSELILEESLLVVSFLETDAQLETSIRVPLPRVLIDPESPIHFTAFDDHIEAKLFLLLPVDHALVSDFDSFLQFEEKSNDLRPLSMDSGNSCLRLLIAHAFASAEIRTIRNCSAKLTKCLRCFEEMPSVNWRDAADNWFGNCCCSFGGVSEELVEKYVKSYTCSSGVCLLNTKSVLLCKDDLLGCELPEVNATKNVGSDSFSLSTSCLNRVSGYEAHTQVQAQCLEDHNEGFPGSHTVGKSVNAEYNKPSIREYETFESVDSSLSCSIPALQSEENKVQINGQNQIGDCSAGCCPSYMSGTLSKVANDTEKTNLLENQKVFLDGYLGDGFMVRSSGISKDIQWNDVLCPECSCLIGAYPSFDDKVPLDGGVRLFKCYIATSSSNSGPDNAFRKYTIERMFTSSLLEFAEDELSFRTIVRDIQTKSPVLQIILLNPNSWCYSGLTTEPAAKLVMHPTVKMLFSTFSNGMESDLRNLEDWVRENQVEEVYMLSSQIQELIRVFELGNALLPLSHKSLQGLSLSSLKR